MALDVVGRDGGSLDSSFQRLNDAMALASKRSAQRRSSTPFTANVVSDCNRSPFDWTRNRGLIFNDYFIESCMGPPCNIRQLDGYPLKWRTETH